MKRRSPSDRVQDGGLAPFDGEPALVADCRQIAMKNAGQNSVTVKSDLPIDDQDPENCAGALARGVIAAGRGHALIRARPQSGSAAIAESKLGTYRRSPYDIVYRRKARVATRCRSSSTGHRKPR